MPNKNWSKLNKMQLGKYAEYYAKMEFASYGFEIFTSEVDDRGIDFIIKNSKGEFFEIQSKSIRKGPVNIPKDKLDILNSSLYIVLLLFKEGDLPEMYLISSTVWKTPNNLFVFREYKNPELKSDPEYGLNISKKNEKILKDYSFEKIIKKMI